MFILLNKHVVFDKSFLQQTGADAFLTLPMSNEQILVPEELLRSLLEVLQGHKGIGKSSQKPIQDLIDLLKKYDKLLS